MSRHNTNIIRAVRYKNLYINFISVKNGEITYGEHSIKIIVYSLAQITEHREQ
jgi:hypothetical protein